MKHDKNYLEFIQSLKLEIIKSRYQAARLANKEQLRLYYKTGKMLSEKVKAQKWGTKVLEHGSCHIPASDHSVLMSFRMVLLQI